MFRRHIKHGMRALAWNIHAGKIEWLGVYFAIQCKKSDFSEDWSANIGWGQDCFVQTLPGASIVVVKRHHVGRSGPMDYGKFTIILTSMIDCFYAPLQIRRSAQAWWAW